MTVEEPGSGEYFGDVVAKRLERRDFLKGAGALGATLVVLPSLASAAADRGIAARRFAGGVDPGGRIQFQPIGAAFDDQIEVAENYDVDVVIRWGEPIFPDAEPFDLDNQSASRQEKQFGFNCDFLTSMPLPSWVESAVERSGRPGNRVLFLLGFLFPRLWRGPSPRMLLWVNHEYTSGTEMFPGYDGSNPTENQVEVELAAHGGSVLGIAREDDGSWSFDIDSPLNRRITGNTRIRLGGPLAGSDLVRTSADPEGRWVEGMFNNCGGGITPWGTILTAEENFDQYFANFAQLTDLVKKALQTLPPPGGASSRKWERFDSRFDVALEPNEYARFGFIVEVDPYDPTSTPVKRTALGRFAEAAVPAHPGPKARLYGRRARFQRHSMFQLSLSRSRSEAESDSPR
jgi:secreted PhoX family phosphatase